MENNELKSQKELYKAHLEFLGWSIEKESYDEETILAKNQRGFFLYLRIQDCAIVLGTYYGTSKYAKRHKLELLEYCNNANRTTCAQYSISDAGMLYIQLFLPSPYERIAFGKFFDLFMGEQSKIMTFPNAGKIFYD